MQLSDVGWFGCEESLRDLWEGAGGGQMMKGLVWDKGFGFYPEGSGQPRMVCEYILLVSDSQKSSGSLQDQGTLDQSSAWLRTRG